METFGPGADGYDSVLYVQRVEAGSRTEASWTQMLGGDAAYNTAEHLYASFETSLVNLESKRADPGFLCKPHGGCAGGKTAARAACATAAVRVRGTKCGGRSAVARLGPGHEAAQ